MLLFFYTQTIENKKVKKNRDLAHKFAIKSTLPYS